MKKIKILILTIFLICLVAFVASSQTCKYSTIQATTSFTDNGNGTVTDLKTGLMWKKNFEPDMYTWKAALQWVKNVNINGGFAGYTDWRLPNIKELGSIVEEQCSDPAINQSFFPDTPPALFLSSSPCDSNIWCVGFTDGNDIINNCMNCGYYVRLVRGGQ